MAIEWRIVITEGEKYRDPSEKKVSLIVLTAKYENFSTPEKVRIILSEN